MRVWCDVYSADGATRLGAGPLMTVRNASVTRALDGAGSVSITVPSTDQRALNLLQNKRRVRLFVEHDNTMRELGRGIIDELRASDATGGWSLTATGPDEVSLLKNKSALIARLYNNVPIATVISSLAGLAGWTASTSALGNLYVRLDGESILKALQFIAEMQGLHLRPGLTPNSIEMGAFGASSGLRCVHVEHTDREMLGNNDILLIENFNLVADSKDMCNWLLPLGAGEGEAAFTLKYSNRTFPAFPYNIETMVGPDGRVLYFIKDSASIAIYGQIEKVGTFKNIAPLSNTDADLTNASNALYDIAVAWLTRRKDKLDVYSFTVRKVRQTVRPGDKVHVRYKGLIYRDGQPVTYRDVNQDMWVLECTERVGVEGLALDLKVATVDRYEQDAARIVIGAIDAIEVRNVRIQPYPSTRSYVYDREIAASYPALVPIRITNATLSLQRCSVRIKTTPFRTTSLGGASGGGGTLPSAGTHMHRVSLYNGPYDGSVAMFDGYYVSRDESGDLLPMVFRVNVGGDIWTHGAAGDHFHAMPAHTHPPIFGIADDTDTPFSIRIFVNGIDRTTDLGGPFAPIGGATTIDLDAGKMTGYLNNAAGGLRQEHILEIRCIGGQGRVEVQVELYETVQSIAVV